MASALTLTSLRARVRDYLLTDASNTYWSDNSLQEAIASALEEYSRTRPLKAIGTITGVTAREVALSSLTGLLGVDAVWFPYLAADMPANWCRFEFLENSGSFSIFLYVETAPIAGDVIRVFYSKQHTLNGLDSETTTTFPKDVERLLALGAAGYACYIRSVDLVENATLNAVGTPNLAELGSRYLDDFRAQLGVTEFNQGRLSLHRGYPRRLPKQPKQKDDDGD